MFIELTYLFVGMIIMMEASTKSVPYPVSWVGRLDCKQLSSSGSKHTHQLSILSCIDPKKITTICGDLILKIWNGS